MADSFAFLTSRQNKTSIQRRKPNKDLNLTNNSIINDMRPFTTSLGRTHNHYAYRNLDNAEQELNETFGSEASSYVAQNIRNLTKKYNEKLFMDETYSLNSTILSTESNIKSQSQPRNVRQMKICGLVYPTGCKVQNVLGQPFFINAKEKLARMIARKKQKQNQFQSIEYRVKEIQRQRLIAKREKDRKFQNPEPVTKSEWDNQWRAQSIKQVARYRTRLSVKHKKLNSNLTIQW